LKKHVKETRLLLFSAILGNLGVLGERLLLKLMYPLVISAKFVR